MSLSGLLRTAATTCAAVLISSVPLVADDRPDAPDRERKVPGSKEAKDSKKGGERDSGRPGMPRHRWDSSRYSSAFDSLSDEERARIRSALQQVWSDPEVIAAKKNLQESTEHYRETLRTALAKVDPEMQSILKKIMMGSHGPGGPGRGGPPPGSPRDWGDPNKPGYALGALERFQKEFSERLRPDMRETFKTAHDAAIGSPQVVETLKRVEESKDVRTKMEGVRKLREAYRDALVKESPLLKPFVTRPLGSGIRPPGIKGSTRRPTGTKGGESTAPAKEESDS